MITKRYFLKIAPVAAPRMTKGDRFNPRKRPCVRKYFDYRDALRLLVGVIDVPDCVDIRFRFAVPESWSKKKKEEMIGKLHKQTPDGDNLVKSVLDGLWTSDGGISVIRCVKHWDKESAVILECFYLEPGDYDRRLFPVIA